MYIFYPDVYFFSQFVTAVFAIGVLNCIYHMSLRKKRIWFAGLIFGLVSTLMVILISPFKLYCILVHIGAIPVTLFIVCRRIKAKELLRNIVTTYVAIWMLYGCMEWVTIQTGWRGNLLLCACSVFLYLIVFFVNQVRKHLQYQIPVILCHKGKKLSLTAYCDTGNLLTDPYCGKPVHVINREILKPFLEETEEENYRLIPYETVAGKELMEGYTLDEMILCKKNPIVLKKVVVGMSKNELFQDKSIQLLLNVSQLNL